MYKSVAEHAMKPASSPKGFSYQTQSVVSFRVYEASEKTRLKTKYPFLSADQINRKIKQQWNQLQKSEQKCFTKKCVKLTPIKDKKKNSPNSHRTKSATKKHMVTTKQRSKKVELNVCDTPEYVNPQKLRDFRNQHDEKYSSDFFTSCSKRASDSNKYKPVNLEKSTEHFGMAESSSSQMRDEDIDSDNLYNSPMVDTDQESSDEDNAVLLKRTDMSSISDGYNFKDDTDTDDNQDNLLIKRDTTEYSNPTDHYSQQSELDQDCTKPSCTDTNKRKHMTDGEDQDNGCNKKKTKLDNSDGTILNSKISNDDCQHDNKNSNLNTSQDSGSFKSPLQKDTGKERKTRSTVKCTPAMTPTIGTNTEKMNADVTPAVGIHLNKEDTKYYTPLMNEEVQQLTLHEAGKAPQKKKQDQADIDHNERMKAAAAGRRVTKSLMPMTENDLQEIESKICPENDTAKPQDQRSNSENNENVCKKPEDEPVKKQTRRKSLRRKSVDNVYQMKKVVEKRKPGKENKRKSEAKIFSDSDSDDFHSECKLQNSTGKPKSTVKTERRNLTSKTHKKMNSHMNPSGDACNVDQENIHQLSEQTNSLTSEPAKDVSENKDSTSIDVSKSTNAAGEFQVEESQQYLMSESGESQMSQSPSPGSSKTSLASMDDTQDSSNSSKKQKMNPALLRAIDCLRLTTVTGTDKKESDWHKLREDSDSDLSSPRLLSPALSGISELSSLSSSSSQTANTDKVSQDSIPRQLTIRGVVAQNGNDLCKMFADVTPPDRKTKGVFKTQRILQSGNPNRSNFKQLFKDDEDFIFT